MIYGPRRRALALTCIHASGFVHIGVCDRALPQHLGDQEDQAYHAPEDPLQVVAVVLVGVLGILVGKRVGWLGCRRGVYLRGDTAVVLGRDVAVLGRIDGAVLDALPAEVAIAIPSARGDLDDDDAADVAGSPGALGLDLVIA